MNNSLSSVHPCEIFILVGMLIFFTTLDLIDACLLLVGSKTQTLSNNKNISEIGTIATKSVKENHSLSPSTKPGTRTVAPKKEAGTFVAVSPLKPSASSPKTKPSESLSASTKSTTPKRTRKKSTTSPLHVATLPGTLKSVPTTNETNETKSLTNH